MLYFITTSRVINVYTWNKIFSLFFLLTYDLHNILKKDFCFNLRDGLKANIHGKKVGHKVWLTRL